jgi:hypothetical protein
MSATKQQQCLNLPTEFSSSAKWKQWHIALVSCVGKEAANSLWIQLWDIKGSSSTNAYDSSLAQYMRTQGVAIEESGGQQVARNLSDLGVYGFCHCGGYQVCFRSPSQVSPNDTQFLLNGN